jgi:hypothetical protein
MSILRKILQDKKSYWPTFKKILFNIAEGNAHFNFEEHVTTFKGNWRNRLVSFNAAPGYE